MTKGYLIKIVVSLMMMLTAVTAQENVDAIEKARQAKEAADKAAAEAAAATSAAIEAAAAKAAKEADINGEKKQNVKKEEEEARKIAEAKAAEEAEPFQSGIDWGNFMFTSFFNIIYGLNHKDVLCCAKSFYLDDIDVDRLNSKGFSIDIELMCMLSLSIKNFKQVQLKYSRRSRNEGKKLKVSNGWSILFCILKMTKYF